MIRRKKKVFDKSGKHEKFKEKVWLASPTMHGEELQYMQEAYDTNWMSTIGVNINEVETQIAEKVGTDQNLIETSNLKAAVFTGKSLRRQQTV